MEASSEYETKIVCDSPCQRCKHSREKDVSLHGQELLWYCRSCRIKYLCKEVLGKARGSSDFICPKCNSSVSELTVERAAQLGLAFGVQITRTDKVKRPIEEIKQTWFYSLGRTILSKDFVTDLIEYEELTAPLLSDLLYHSDLDYGTNVILDKKRFLWDIFSKKPNIIKSIHNSLITKSEHRRVDLIIRALIDYRTLGCSYLSSIIPGNLTGTVDLIGVDEASGGLIWIVVQEKKIDEQIINSILNEILSIPPLEFMGVERIILLTRKWIWMAAEIARRQGKITTRWKQIKLELWEEDSLFNHRKI